MAFVTAETPAPPDQGRGRFALARRIIGVGQESRQAFTDSNGRAEITLEGTGPGLVREIERIVVRVNDTTNIPFAFIYSGDEQDQNLRDGTSNGDLDFAEYSPRLRLSPNTLLRVVWTGADADKLATAHIQWSDVQYDGGAG